ncbi:37S ribosomal protein S19, mitochondrial [Erysiphe neolycopersici]|uniref:37S ribosomal protein S19, mitochondrial n=1 Tax=Erysiphe neolycopersici TaxID=212602 RepID=A0A420HB84_9PEZI|nr:37S ribosomal protein S19, mitochondrial [Erysiphe neolycopersici]
MIGPTVLPIAIPKVAPGEKMPPIKTQARAATILPTFVGLVFQVHNGKSYINVEITEDMVGHKLGEFSPYEFLKKILASILTHNAVRENHFLTSRVRTSDSRKLQLDGT